MHWDHSDGIRTVGVFKVIGRWGRALITGRVEEFVQNERTSTVRLLSNRHWHGGCLFGFGLLDHRLVFNLLLWRRVVGAFE